MKSIIDVLVNDLEIRHKDFKCDGYYLMDNVSGVKCWVSNGLFLYHVTYPCKVHLSFIDKIRFHMAFKKWKVKTVLYDLKHKVN